MVIPTDCWKTWLIFQKLHRCCLTETQASFYANFRVLVYAIRMFFILQIICFARASYCDVWFWIWIKWCAKNCVTFSWPRTILLKKKMTLIKKILTCDLQIIFTSTFGYLEIINTTMCYCKTRIIFFDYNRF